MTTSALHDTQWKPNDKWLVGVVLAMLTFWLFAQTLLNVIPGIQGDLGITHTLANLAVSITSLFSGIFVVVAGGFADRWGRVKIMYAGVILSIVGSVLIVFTPENSGALTSTMLLAGRIIQGLSAACVMPSTMSLVKAFYDGKERQRALSFWSMGSWGGSGVCSLFGGFMATTALGWRSIFVMSIIAALVSLWLLRGTPESKAEEPTEGHQPFDWKGLTLFIISLLAINIYISQGPEIGWLSVPAIILLVVFVVAGLIFLQVEVRQHAPFVNLKVFKNGTFTGATVSNFLLNGAAGTLIVSLGLVQTGAGMSSLQSGLLTIGYLIAVLTMIRVGEKLMQHFGPRRPMIWGCLITGAGILLCSMTFLLVPQYIVVAVIGFTLFGIGLGFYATPSTDSAMSTVDDDHAGAAAGIYKMASSLGNATGVAISAALYAAGQNVDQAMIQSWGLFWGNQENVALRFGGAIGLLFNLLMVAIALGTIILAIPSDKKRMAADHKNKEIPPAPIGN